MSQLFSTKSNCAFFIACGLISFISHPCNAQEQNTIKQQIVAKWKRVLEAENQSIEIARLIGFLDGSLGVDVPQNWAEVFLKCPTPDGKLDFSRLESEMAARHQNFIKNLGRAVAPKALSLNKELHSRLSMPGVYSDSISQEFYCYVFVRPANRIDGTLYCINSINGGNVWQMETRWEEKDSELVSGAGPVFGNVEMVASRQMLYLYAWDSTGFLITAIAKRDGREAFRVKFPTS